MAAKISAAVGIFLALNFLFLSTTDSACDTCHNPTYGPGTRSGAGTCPRDALKLGVCANVLRGLLHVIVGQPPKTPCCSLIQGLADVEAAACLCIAIKANLLGINLNVPLSLNLLLNYCGFRAPIEFRCA